MPDSSDPLVLDLIEWLGAEPRPYREVMEAWRTSCPRLTVWEDAVDRGLVARQSGARGEPQVVVTPLGREALARARMRISLNQSFDHGEDGLAPAASGAPRPSARAAGDGTWAALRSAVIRRPLMSGWLAVGPG